VTRGINAVAAYIAATLLITVIAAWFAPETRERDLG